MASGLINYLHPRTKTDDLYYRDGKLYEKEPDIDTGMRILKWTSALKKIKGESDE